MLRKPYQLAVFVSLCAAISAHAVYAADATDAQKQADKKAEKHVKPGEINGFNPQPDPPGDKNGLKNPGAAQGFNPQPEPPGDKNGVKNPGVTHGFNPQPDPPGVVGKQNQQVKQ